MKNLVFALLSLVVLAPAAALAKPYHFTSVRWIVDTRNNISVDDQYVTIVGHVTRRISDEEYWFADATGQIRLDSENFDLPIGPRLVIGGRIDQAYLGFGHIEVDVRHWHYAPVHRTAAAVAHPVTHVATPAPAVTPMTHTTTTTTQPAPPPVTPAPLAPEPEPAVTTNNVPVTPTESAPVMSTNASPSAIH